MRNIGRSNYAAKYAPPRVGSVVGRVLRDAGLDDVIRAQRMVTAWRRVVPKHVAEGTRLLRVREGVVHVAVDSSALLFELKSFLCADVLAGLRAADVGYVRDLKFVLDTSEEVDALGAVPRGSRVRSPSGDYNPAH